IDRSETVQNRSEIARRQLSRANPTEGSRPPPLHPQISPPAECSPPPAAAAADASSSSSRSPPSSPSLLRSARSPQSLTTRCAAQPRLAPLSSLGSKTFCRPPQFDRSSCSHSVASDLIAHRRDLALVSPALAS
uniref:Uncharacterized protein n=1 Tax=Aegilops tauschii subsp. strangulata TaxID=200361 RepID=A0A453K899_AEGTS